MRFIQISTAKNGSAGGRARPATIFGRSFMTHRDKTSSVTRRHTTPRPRMCYKTTCSTCKKPTWGG